MFWILFLLLTIVPAVEIYVLVLLTQYWGSFGLTLALLLGTGLLGAVLARHEGLRVIRRMQDQMARGELPTDSILDGVLILVAGALLIAPGFLTDIVGFLLLLPPGRALVRYLVKRWIGAQIRKGRFVVQQGMTFGPIRQDPPPGAPPIEDETPFE